MEAGSALSAASALPFPRILNCSPTVLSPASAARLGHRFRQHQCFDLSGGSAWRCTQKTAHPRLQIHLRIFAIKLVLVLRHLNAAGEHRKLLVRIVGAMVSPDELTLRGDPHIAAGLGLADGELAFRVWNQGRDDLFCVESLPLTD